MSRWLIIKWPDRGKPRLRPIFTCWRHTRTFSAMITLDVMLFSSVCPQRGHTSARKLTVTQLHPVRLCRSQCSFGEWLIHKETSSDPGTAFPAAGSGRGKHSHWRRHTCVHPIQHHYLRDCNYIPVELISHPIKTELIHRINKNNEHESLKMCIYSTFLCINLWHNRTITQTIT